MLSDDSNADTLCHHPPFSILLLNLLLLNLLYSQSTLFPITLAYYQACTVLPTIAIFQTAISKRYYKRLLPLELKRPSLSEGF